MLNIKLIQNIKEGLKVVGGKNSNKGRGKKKRKFKHLNYVEE